MAWKIFAFPGRQWEVMRQGGKKTSLPSLQRRPFSSDPQGDRRNATIKFCTCHADVAGAAVYPYLIAGPWRIPESGKWLHRSPAGPRGSSDAIAWWGWGVGPLSFCFDGEMLFPLDELTMSPRQKSADSARCFVPGNTCPHPSPGSVFIRPAWVVAAGHALSPKSNSTSWAEVRLVSVFATSGTNMKGASHGAVVGIAMGSSTYPVKEMMGKPHCDAVSSRIASTSYGSSQIKQKRPGAVIAWMNKFSKMADSYVQSIREHVRFRPKLANKLKGKANLRERILQAGGVEGAFTQIFDAREGEKLLKALRCHLSTTAGPIAGMLFISTEKIAFHSDRSLTVTSIKGEVISIPYKVMIPLKKVKRADLSENVNKPSHKYMQIATVDNFEFWFMGFSGRNRSFKHAQKATCFAQ